MYKFFPITDLFKVKSGDFHATKELDQGKIPLISCGEYDNGLVGHFDIENEYMYSKTITIAYNGQPLTSKYHPYRFGAKDDVAVLLPLVDLDESTLIYIAAWLNHRRWRYSYGRKCFKNKMKQINIELPAHEDGSINEDFISSLHAKRIHNSIPHKKKNIEKFQGNIHLKLVPITDLFYINRGDFHSLKALDEGNVRTVSRVSYDNGTVRYCTPPEKAKRYSSGVITVSTVSGDAFVQLSDFIATDNVVICIPIIDMSITTLFFINAILNANRWRFSYGRQCYKTKFASTELFLPYTKDDKLDEELMKRIVKNTSFWHIIEIFYNHS